MSRVALQLYTVRDACSDDLADTLARTAELGFEGVELYDLHGLAPGRVRELLDANGLTACGRHAGLPLIEQELDALADELRAVGTDRLIVSWIEPPRTSAEAAAVHARLLAAAAQVAGKGLRLGFHNHDGELAALDDGRSLLDRLLDAADDPLFLELDLGWVWYAGVDPLALLAGAGGRAPLVHVKDMRRNGSPFAALGRGEVDYGALREVAEHAGVEWLIVEQDETSGPAFDDVAVSLAALRSLLGVAP